MVEKKKEQKNMKTYELNRWGKTYTIEMEKGTYADNGTLAIIMVCVDENGYREPFATLTINIEASDTEADSETLAFVDTNNLDMSIIAWLGENDIAEFAGIIGYSGFCRYPLMRFKAEALNEMRTLK
jgi:hypothetical protein